MIVHRWPWVERNLSPTADLWDVGLQQSYVVPFMLMPDKPFSFMEWLEALNLAMQIQTDYAVGLRADRPGGKNVHFRY